ncbi:MAG: hypothetical protein GC159_05345 [Phycisphaera sp.]|nr:hypothetical protein [Phycisphaera sp.]
MTLRTRSRVPHGFTIIELLVVVSIIMLILAILLPSMRDARAVAKIAVCSSNQKELHHAWFNYASENSFGLVSPNNYEAHSWAKAGNTVDALRNGKLWPYLLDKGVYQCPADPRDYLRSYSINHFLGGERPESWGIKPVGGINTIPQPGRTLLFVDEDDPRGYNINSWVIQPHGAADQWIDWPGGWHTVGQRRGGDPLCFADGHLETYWFQDPRTVDIDWFYEPAPNSSDLEWFRDRYNPGQRDN